MKTQELALVHDYLLQIGGAERVVETFVRAWPDAPLLVSATNPELLTETLRSTKIENTWMQHMPGIRRHFKKYFAVFPFAFASHPPVRAALVLISSSGYAKWVRSAPGAVTVCYCHTPPRFFWQPENYLNYEVGNPLMRKAVLLVLEALRRSDLRQSRQVDHFIANSENVRARIREFYGRDSVVIHPPVEIRRFQVSTISDEYALLVSRLIGYKRIDLAVRAFSGSGRRLIVVGDGPDRSRLEGMAGEEVKFTGRLSDPEVRDLMARCKLLVFPGEEDFGIVPVEAMACGKPVVAFGRGGALESVRAGVTGCFFQEPEIDSLREAVELAWSQKWDPAVIRKHAEGFGEDQFIKKIQGHLQNLGGGYVVSHT